MQMNESFPDKGFEVKALQASEKARTRLMRENLRFSEDEFTIDADPELVKKENNLARRISLKKEELTTKLSEGEKDEHLDILIGEISNLDDRLQSIRDTLKRKSPIYSAIKSPDDFDISKFQKNILDDQTVLIEFFFGKRKSYVWLISKSGFEVFTLPKFQQLEYRIDRLLKLINARDVIPKNNVRIYQKLIAENEQNYWIEAKELSQILFGQFAGKLKNKRLLIVPDGRLSFFPISALPSPEDELNKPFIFTNEIIYESSASMLQLIRSFRNLSTPPEKDFIVYSDSVFSKNDERLTNPDYLVSLKDSENNKSSLALEENAHISLDNLERLDKSRNETENIFKNFEINNSTIVSGFDANRTNFQKKHHNNYKVLHFATHGLLNEEIPELSGIVLSQFDRDGRKQNGLIWLEDIYNLNLSADLVVLSACDTGIGKDVKGEGLMSLTNGFLQVGAKSVISSHWKVDDEATVELMKIYYEILAKEKVSTSRALQLAQIKLAENPKFQFPYYWSSFTIHGDFIIRPQLKSRFDYSEYFIYLIITLISVALLNRFKKHSLNKLFNYK
jgi:CHAT domain-containing protein